MNKISLILYITYIITCIIFLSITGGTRTKPSLQHIDKQLSNILKWYSQLANAYENLEIDIKKLKVDDIINEFYPIKNFQCTDNIVLNKEIKNLAYEYYRNLHSVNVCLINKSSYNKILIELYFNQIDPIDNYPKDLIWLSAKENDFKVSIKELIYGVDDELEKLLFISNQINYDVPKNLKKHINLVLFSQKSLINNSQHYDTIKNLKLKLDYPDQEDSKKKAWIYIKNYTIHISFSLVRAIFILSCKRSNPLFQELYSKYLDDTSLSIHGMTNEDKIALYNSIMNTFDRSFNFILGHEMAHAYLGRITFHETNEARCDCYASYYNKLYTITNQSDNKGRGIFDDLLIRSIQENKGYLWGIDEKNEKQILERYNKLNNLPTTITTEYCDQLK